MALKPVSQAYKPLPIHVEPAHTPRQMAMGIVLAIFGSMFFSFKAVFIKLAYGASPDLEPITLLVIRMGIAMPLYALIAVWALRQRARKNPGETLTAKHYIMGGALGLIGYYLAALMDFSGLQFITAQLERLILFTYPAFVMILGALFFGKKMRLSSVAFMALAYSGLVLIFMQGSIATGERVYWGALLILGAAISFALFQLLAAAQIKKMGASLFTCAAMIAAGFGILMQFLVQSISAGNIDNLAAQPPKVWVIGAGIALVSTLLPSFLINVALGRIGAQAVAVIGMISPLSTIVLAVTLLGEPFGIIDGLGTALTILGIGLFTWFERKRQNSKSTPR